MRYFSGSWLMHDSAAEEVVFCRRAMALVAEHWAELAPMVDYWLDDAGRADPSLRGEVAYVILRRSGNGEGYLVGYLRRVPDGSAEHEKAVLFYFAKLVSGDVTRTFRERRRHHPDPVPFDDEHLSGGVAVGGDPTAPVGEDPGGGEGAGRAVDGDRVEGFAEGIRFLLARGEQAFDELCDEGVLDRSDWTDDQKWTAIGMMWGFSPSQIGAIRAAKTNKAASDGTGAIRAMMHTVREKGKRILDAMTRGARLEHGLPLPSDPDELAGGSP